MTQVKLWNRADCCPQRLLPVKILLSSDGASWTQCGYLDGTGAAGAIYTIPCSGKGRYVRVQLDKTDYLTLCEVEVWANPAVDPCSGNVAASLLSTGKPSSQSSDYVWGSETILSRYGNDGVYGQNWNNPSGNRCSHTQQLLNSWWQVDLEGLYAMTQVKLWNRADCCPERLLPVKILLSSDGASWTQCGYLDGTGTAGAIYSIPCKGSGRYVRVQLDKTDYLTLCEVEVWGSAMCLVPQPKPQAKPAPGPVYTP